VRGGWAGQGGQDAVIHSDPPGGRETRAVWAVCSTFLLCPPAMARASSGSPEDIALGWLLLPSANLRPEPQT
jgi:hypothetical protein